MKKTQVINGHPLEVEMADYEDLVSISKGVVEDLRSAFNFYFNLKSSVLNPDNLSQVAMLNKLQEDLKNGLDLNSQVQFFIQQLLDDVDGFKKDLAKPGSVDLTPTAKDTGDYWD